MSRVWRTVDGGYVPDGHPDAAFLAFGIDDAVPDNVASEVAAIPAVDHDPESDADPDQDPDAGDDQSKQQPPPADKSRRPAGNK